MKRIIIMLILTLLLVGCIDTKKKNAAEKPTEIILTADKIMIEPDDRETVVFLQTVIDRNKTDLGINGELYINGEKMGGNSFHTSVGGIYRVHSRIGAIVSNEVVVYAAKGKTVNLKNGEIFYGKYLLISNENKTNYEVNIPVKRNLTDNIKVYEDSHFVIYKKETMEIPEEIYTSLDTIYNVLSDKFGILNTTVSSIYFENISSDYGGFSDGKSITINYYYIKNTNWIKCIIIHELQHMVNYQKKGFFTKDFFNEGFSMSAEQFLDGKIEPVNRRTPQYNNSMEVNGGLSLLYFDWSDINTARANYALSYFFMQYLRYRAGNDYIFKEMLDYNGDEYEMCEIIIKKYVDKNLSFGEFMTQFRIALIRKEISVFKDLNIKLFEGSIVNLKGGGSVLIKIDKPYKVEQEIEGIKYVGIDIQK